jgi:hypothetical protein
MSLIFNVYLLRFVISLTECVIYITPAPPLVIFKAILIEALRFKVIVVLILKLWSY